MTDRPASPANTGSEGDTGSAPAAGARGVDLAQAHDLPLDAHLHSDLSPDSSVPIDVYAADAVRRGIGELNITDHLDFHADAPAFAYADYARRERTVREAAERWADRVNIRFGVEITYEARYDAQIREHLERHAYDYTIGSVHPQSDSPYTRDRIAAFVEGKNLAAVVAPYFDEVRAAIESDLFDTIGHLDYVKRYVVDWFSPRDFAAAPELYEPLLRSLADRGAALEVNSSGFRHRTGETYPGPWAVARYRELGGSRVVAGSDAHAPTHFAFGLEEAYRILSGAGFDEVVTRHAEGRSGLAIPERLLPGRRHVARSAGA